MNIASFIIGKRRASILILVLLFFLGFTLLQNIPITFYPQTSKASFVVYVPAAGYAAEDLYDDFSTDIQGLVSQIKELESNRVFYSSGNIYVFLEFNWDTENTAAESIANTLATKIQDILPSTFDEVQAFANTDGSAGYLAIALYSPTMTNAEIYNEAKALLEVPISKVSDLDSFYISPVRTLRADVTLSERALMNHGLTASEVASAVKASYNSASMGTFRDRNTPFTMRSRSPINTIFEIGQLGVHQVGVQTILLQDVAEVNVRYAMPSSVYQANGEPAIFISATPTQGGDTKLMADTVRTIVMNSLPSFSGEVYAEVFVDPAAFIDTAINNVLNSALIGAMLAILVTLAFLGVPQNTIIVVMAIPLSVIYAFIFLYVFNVSINLISLSGLALSVGMSLDGAIVVMENIHRHRLDNLRLGTGKSLKLIISEATSEVQSAVIMSAITSISVFLPLNFTAPLASAVLGDLALAIVFTLVCSIVVSFTVIPLLAFYLFRKGHNNPDIKPNKISTRLIAGSGWLMAQLSGGYQRALLFLLHRTWLMVSFMAFSLGLLVIAVVVMLPRIPSEIIADPASAIINLDITNNDLTDIDDFFEAFEPIEQEIIDLLGSNLKSRFLNAQVSRSTTRGSLLLTLTQAKKATEMLALLQSELVSDATWTYSVSAYNPAKMPIPWAWGMTARVSGPNRREVLRYMERITELAQQVLDKNGDRAYGWINNTPTTRLNSELTFLERREVFAELSPLTKSTVINHVRLFLNGSTPLKIRTEEGEWVDVRFSFPAVTTREVALNILLPYKNNALPLSHFFEVSVAEGLNRIVVEDGVEVFDVNGGLKAGTSAREIVTFQKDLEASVKEKITFAPGYGVTFMDAQKIITEAIDSLKLALIISVLLVFVVLTIQFNSLRLASIILVAIPLGAIGAIFSLFFAGSTLSINSMLGIILLGGIAINNSILIVDFYVKDTHSSSKQAAIMRACLLRFPPILSSTVTTLLGMLPIALAIGDGANVIQPLGIAVTGGLAISTFFTLFMIPSILFMVKMPKVSDE